MLPPKGVDKSVFEKLNNQPCGQNDSENSAKQEQIEAILRAYLTPDARERIKRISIVKPQKASEIELSIINEIRTNRMVPPITDDKLLEFLSKGKAAEECENHRKIRFVRKSAFDSD